MSSASGGRLRRDGGKILRRFAPLNDKFGGVPVFLSFRAQRGILPGEGFACGRGTLPTAAKYPKRRREVPDPGNGALCQIGLWGRRLFPGGLQNVPTGKPTHQIWQKCMALRGLLTRPLCGLQRQDGISVPGCCAHRRRRRCGLVSPAGGTGVAAAIYGSPTRV